MFKKPPSIKSLSVLRSSDRKKAIHQIVESFGLEDLDVQTRNSLLPEGAQVSPFPVCRYRCLSSSCSVQSLLQTWMNRAYCIIMRRGLSRFGLKLMFRRIVMKSSFQQVPVYSK
jgi:hypothetical protein